MQKFALLWTEMARTMAKADIEINDHLYSVACAAGQEARLQALGALLDARVKKIAEAVGDIGEARLLLVASLALLDELDMARRAGPAAPEAERKASTALVDAAARIEAIASRLDTAS